MNPYPLVGLNHFTVPRVNLTPFGFKARVSHDHSCIVALGNLRQNFLQTLVFIVINLAAHSRMHQIVAFQKIHAAVDHLGSVVFQFEQSGDRSINLILKLGKMVHEPAYLSTGAFKIVSHMCSLHLSSALPFLLGLPLHSRRGRVLVIIGG
jgi:hypothetical protein